MGAASLTNSLATHVSQTSPTTNYKSSYGLYLRTGGTGDSLAYLYFPRPFPLQATILSAKIKFYNAVAFSSATHTVTFQRLNQAFSVSTVTYNTRPTSLIAGTKTVTKTGTVAVDAEWEIDVTDWMQTISNGGVHYGMRMIINEAILRTFYSENHPTTALRPRLEISWSDAPQTPADLSPSGGRAVGLAKPVLKATYRDYSGATQLASLQVQINAADSWGAPSFDSGTVITSVPELDLNTTAYAGLTDGATTFWRIRFQDAAGVWSAWSTAVSFKRDDKGTLTVTNPPVGTPTVEDATPPIAWTFTGETQAAYQVQVRHVLNGVQIIDWDSGKVTSTVTSVTVPSGINEPTNTTYTVTVRIWDAKQREATPGDNTYVEVVRDFTFVPGATTGTTGLTAVPQDPVPKVVLTWTAATFPDRFNVLRNGKVIAAALEPTNTFVSGTTHTYTDNSPSPGRALTYSVQRVVNNVASATNSTAVATVRSSGIWLREPGTGLELCLFGRDGREFTLGEQGAVLQSIAQNANKVAINQSLGGLEGRVEGTLENMYGKTAQQWRDIYLQLRALRVKKFWLTVGDYTFEVVAQNFSYSPLPTGETRFRVGFDVYQQNSVSTALLGS